MPRQIVYLMRGLPSTGKSWTAKRLAGETGVVCETDAFFYTQVGDDPTVFQYDRARMAEARDWNYARFTRAVDEGRSPIVVDRGNGLSREAQRYARYAVDRGCRVELREPESPWWREIRPLLGRRFDASAEAALDDWARRLAAMSKATHRVSAATIRRRMAKWKPDMTVDELLSYRPDG